MFLRSWSTTSCRQHLSTRICRLPRSSTSCASPAVRRLLSSAASSAKDDDAYCVDLVQRRDREAYLCGLLVPAGAHRRAFFALRAWNVELASIKDQQRPTDGETSLLALQLRMQWWRDAVGRLYEENDDGSMAISPLGPVVRSLARAHQQSPFTRRFLERLIDIREADLEVKQYQTVAALTQYVEDSMSSLLYLTLESQHVRTDEADEVAYHAGIGIGLTTALRAIPYKLSHGEHPLPVELIPSDFSYDRLETEDSDEAETFRAACQTVASSATEHFVAARNLQGKAPSSILLTMVPSLHYLSKLEASNYRALDAAAMTAGTGSDRLSLLLLLGRTWLTGVL